MPIQEFELPKLARKVNPVFKRPQKTSLGSALRTIGQSIQLIDSPPKSGFLTNSQCDEIRRHLYYALDSVLRDSGYEARNYLTVAADLVLRSRRKRLPIERPRGVSLAKLRSFKFHAESGEDLWDTVRIPKADQRRQYYRANNPYLGRMLLRPENTKEIAASKLLLKIFEAAFETSPRLLLRRQLDEQIKNYQILSDTYAQLPSTWQTRKISTELLSQLDPVYGFTTSQTINNVAALLEIGIISNLYSADAKLDIGKYSDVRGHLDFIEKGLHTYQTIIEYVVNEASAQDAAARAAIKNNDIWDLILNCTSGQFREKFENSLDDWCERRSSAFLCN